MPRVIERFAQRRINLFSSLYQTFSGENLITKQRFCRKCQPWIGAAQKEQEQTRRLEAAMTALQERQMVELEKRTPECAPSGLTGSYRQTMTVAGIASGPSQRSMQEISRFFERDARRYG